VEIEVVTAADRLAELEPEWVALQDATDPPYYVRHHFVQAWWRAYQDTPGYELRILVVRNNGEVVGIAPLALVPQKRKGRPIRSLRFASHGDYMGILIDAAATRSETICRMVMQHIEEAPEWDTVSLGNVPSFSPLAHYLLKSTKYNDAFSLQIENPYLDLRTYASLDEYAETHPLKRARKQRSKFYREVSPEFVIIDGNRDNVLGRMGELHRREKEHLQEVHDRTERHSLFDDERRVQLYRQIYDGAGETLTFAYQSKRGELLGYRSCYVDGTTLLSWNSAYHPDYDSYRIGKVIQYDILEHLFGQDRFDRFDFGAGRYPWKFEWTDQFSSTYRLILRRPSADPPPKAPAAPQKVAAPEPAPTTTPNEQVEKDAAPADVRGGSGVASAAHRALRRLRRGRSD